MFTNCIEMPHKIMTIEYLPHEYGAEKGEIPQYLMKYIDDRKLNFNLFKI